MSHEQEADILTILLPVHLRQLLLQFRQLDTAADGTSGIHHLLSLEGEVIAPVRHVYLGGIAEITIPQLAVAPVAARERRTDVGQPLCLGSFQVLVGNFLSGTVSLDTLAVLVGQTEHLFYAHRTRLGTQILAAQYCTTQHYEPACFAHTNKMFIRFLLNGYKQRKKTCRRVKSNQCSSSPRMEIVDFVDVANRIDKNDCFHDFCDVLVVILAAKVEN